MNHSEFGMRHLEQHAHQQHRSGKAQAGFSGAGLGDPVDILTAEDDEALVHIERFEAAAGVIMKRGFSAEAFATISAELHYIHTSLRRHCAIEVRYLLPLLLLHRAGVRETDQWSWHDIWEKVDELRERVEDLEDGHIHSTLVHEMAEGCRTAAEMIREQLLRERQEILPVVKEVLTAKEYRQLREKFAQQETT